MVLVDGYGVLIMINMTVFFIVMFVNAILAFCIGAFGIKTFKAYPYKATTKDQIKTGLILAGIGTFIYAMSQLPVFIYMGNH